jgi:hypothetical protein
MLRKTLLFGLLAVCTVAAARCSSPAEAPMSPSAIVGASHALNDDGSSLKVTAPAGLSPNAATIDTRKPTLSFANAAGRFTGVGLAYELEVQTANGNVVYSRVIGQSAATSAHELEIELEYETDYWWRVRARLGNDTGPWAGFAQFRTLNRPTPVGPPRGSLPFPIPAECGPSESLNRFGCAAAIAAQSVEWGGCAGGRGVNCHRFVRQVVYALSQSDPNWRLITASPGGHACNCFGCGPSDGTMFREDTVVYGGNTVFDMIVGAGGPSPSLNWTLVPGPRSGDIPDDAPLCVP